MSKDRGLAPRALDLALLGRLGQTLQGEWPQAEMPRLADSLAAPPTAGACTQWSAAGSLLPVSGGEPELWLLLSASAPVVLQCQRCLQPLAHTLAVDRRMRFVRGADEAARLDEEIDDDVLELPPRLDLRELVEDELILALPLVPMHDVCPDPLLLPLSAAGAPHDEPAAANPFAALAVLRGRAPH